MAESDSREIAALIAKECKKKGISYNNTKIQKLLYCCYGVMLAWKNARICDEYPRLWPYGPVFPKVFNYIHKYGDIANFSTDISKVSTPENKEVIESVLNAFGKYDATSLSSWSHTEGSPWDRAKQENANWNSFIPDEEGAILIKKLEQRKTFCLFRAPNHIRFSCRSLSRHPHCLCFASHTAGKLALAHRGRSRHDKEHLSLSLWWSDRDISHKLFFEKMKIIF